MSIYDEVFEVTEAILFQSVEVDDEIACFVFVCVVSDSSNA